MTVDLQFNLFLNTVNTFKWYLIVKHNFVYCVNIEQADYLYQFIIQLLIKEYTVNLLITTADIMSPVRLNLYVDEDTKTCPYSPNQQGSSYLGQYSHHIGRLQ